MDGGLRFPKMSYSCGKTAEKLNQVNGSDWESNPDPLGELQRCYPSNTAGVLTNFDATSNNQHFYDPGYILGYKTFLCVARITTQEKY